MATSFREWKSMKGERSFGGLEEFLQIEYWWSGVLKWYFWFAKKLASKHENEENIVIESCWLAELALWEILGKNINKFIDAIMFIFNLAD